MTQKGGGESMFKIPKKRLSKGSCVLLICSCVWGVCVCLCVRAGGAGKEFVCAWVCFSVL